MATRDPLVVFTPSGKRGNFPVGTPLLQAARSLGVDIDSVCGGRGLCGRCQVLVAEGEFAKHGVSSSSASLSPFSEPERRFSRRVPLAPGRRLSCSARVEADVVIDVPASSQVHRQVVRKEADARVIELNPVVRLHYVQVKQPDMHDPSGDLRRLFEALEAEWSLKDLTCDLSVLQTLQPTLRAGIVAGDGGGARRQADHRGVARPARAGLRTRGRRRLDDDCGAPVRSEQRRGRGLRGRHESADPLRRGSDEPRVLFDDESGRRGADDGGGARGAMRARGGRRASSGHLPRGHSRGDAGRQSDHASPAARHRSGGARRRAVRARHRSLAHAARQCHRLQIASQRAHLCAAVHRRTRGRGRRGHGACRAAGSRGRDDAAGGCRHECRNRARQQRAAASPARAPRVPHSRARRSAAGSARRRERSSACASTARHSSRASR